MAEIPFNFNTMPITKDITLTAKWKCPEPPIIYTILGGEGTVHFVNTWGGDVTFNGTQVASGETYDLEVTEANVGDTVEVRGVNSNSMRTWYNGSSTHNSSAYTSVDDTVEVSVNITTYEPFFDQWGPNFPEYAFQWFCGIEYPDGNEYRTAITKLLGDADFSTCLNAQYGAFINFARNNQKVLDSIAELGDNNKLFDTSGLSYVSGGFCSQAFSISNNYDINYSYVLEDEPEAGWGVQVSLPNSWFHFDNLNQCGQNFMENAFAGWTGLAALPSGSFSFDSLTVINGHNSLWAFLEAAFCNTPSLTALPAGSFSFASLQNISAAFMSATFFGSNITGLPEGSFDFVGVSSITGDFLCKTFAYNRAESFTVPSHAFRISPNVTSIPREFMVGTFRDMTNLTAPITLPDDMLDISNLTNISSSFLSDTFYNTDIANIPSGILQLSNVEQIQYISSNRFGNGVLVGTFGFEVTEDRPRRTSALVVAPGSLHFNTQLSLHEVPTLSKLFSGRTLGAPLPAGSFNTDMLSDFSTVTWGGGTCNETFKDTAGVVLPEGSFKFDNITTTWGVCNDMFNGSDVKSLPAQSFGFSSSTNISSSFNRMFKGVTFESPLPSGCFSFSDSLVSVSAAFSGFLEDSTGAVLPDGSFNFSKITNLHSGTFTSFAKNAQGLVLPADGFKFDSAHTLSLNGGDFFTYGFYGTQLTSLPLGSFNWHITTYSGTSGEMLSHFAENSTLEKGNQGIKIELPKGATSFYSDGESVSYNSYGYLNSSPAPETTE